MTATETATATVERTAANAALSVPGVVELQPTLRQSLAGAATSVRQFVGSPAPSPEAGIRTETRAGTGDWHLEVRCVVTEDRRALDIARDVHDHVQAAVASHGAHRGSPPRITVTLTRITGP